MTSTETQAAGPEFASRKPRMNHVAMSLSPEELDEEHRRLRAEFLSDVFGFYDLPMLTEDKNRQVFQVHNIEQFVFLIADDPPMTCARSSCSRRGSCRTTCSSKKRTIRSTGCSTRHSGCTRERSRRRP